VNSPLYWNDNLSFVVMHMLR